jgi:hypothetical protein
MYLVGAHKADAQRLLESSVAAGAQLVTSAEVLPEPALLVAGLRDSLPHHRPQ